MINSRAKGKRGERAAVALLREHGWTARRGQQFAGGPDSPDVVSPDFPYHIEVKYCERLKLNDAVSQAASQCGNKPWVILHKWRNGPWLAIFKPNPDIDSHVIGHKKAYMGNRRCTIKDAVILCDDIYMGKPYIIYFKTVCIMKAEYFLNML